MLWFGLDWPLNRMTDALFYSFPSEDRDALNFHNTGHGISSRFWSFEPETNHQPKDLRFPVPSVTTVFSELFCLLPSLVSFNQNTYVPQNCDDPTPAELPLHAKLKHRWTKQANKSTACTVLFPPSANIADTIKSPPETTLYSRKLLQSSKELKTSSALATTTTRRPHARIKHT